MAFKILAILLISVAAASAGVLPTVEVLQGPSSKTILHGPDGSLLDAASPGGTVLTNAGGSGLVAAGPADLPLGTPYVVHGPAGSISTSYSLGGPAVVAGVAPAVPIAVAAGPIAASAGSIVASAGSVAAAAGAYVADAAEALYDDGSYREGY